MGHTDRSRKSSASVRVSFFPVIARRRGSQVYKQDFSSEVFFRSHPDAAGNVCSPIATVFQSASFISALEELALQAEVVRARQMLVTQPISKTQGSQNLDPANLFFDSVAARARALRTPRSHADPPLAGSARRAEAPPFRCAGEPRRAGLGHRRGRRRRRAQPRDPGQDDGHHQPAADDRHGRRPPRRQLRRARARAAAAAAQPVRVPWYGAATTGLALRAADATRPRLADRQQVVPGVRPPEARSDLVDLMRVVNDHSKKLPLYPVTLTTPTHAPFVSWQSRRLWACPRR